MFQLSQRPIRAQLSVLLIAAVGFLVLVAGIAARDLVHNVSAATETNERNVPRQRAANDLLLAVNARAVAARNLTLAVTPEVRDAELAKVKAGHAATQDAVAKLEKLASDMSGEEKSLVDEIVAAEAAYGPVALKITGVAASGDVVQAAALIIKECRPLLERLDGAVQKLLKYEAAHAQEDHEAMIADTQAMVAWLSGIAVTALVLLVWLGFSITRGLVASSQAALDAVEKMAAGDMSLHLQAQGNSEPQRVLRSLDGMAARLREVLTTVRQASDQIATASAEVATGSQDLSGRTEQAASNLQQTAASMEEMTATVQQSSNSAREANQLAVTSADVARRGGEVVGQVVQTMDQINKSSGRIGEIIGVIDGIAFQTNILALNAAVEAARAGEQGRGFAVVASEVRNLAQRSAQAAKEIKQLIENSNAQVTSGLQQVQQAGGTIAEVVENAVRVSSIVSEIMSTSTEQADGVGQINVAVSQLDHMTQQNAALVEQTSAAAASLKAQASQLLNAVAVFKLGQAA